MQFQCTRGGIARVGEQRLFLIGALLIQPLEVCPRQQHLAAHLKAFGDILALDMPRDGRDGLNVLHHVVAFLPIAAGNGFGERPMLIPERYTQSVELQLAHYLHSLGQFA